MSGPGGHHGDREDDLAKKLGSVPKAIEKQLWDVLAVTDPEAPVITNRKGQPEPDPDLRDNENVPLPELVCHGSRTSPAAGIRGVPDGGRGLHGRRGAALRADAWVDYDKTKIGLRDPAHPLLLQVRATAAVGRDRLRTYSAAKSLAIDGCTGSRFTGNIVTTQQSLTWTSNGRAWSRSRLSGLLGSNWGSAQECQK